MDKTRDDSKPTQPTSAPAGAVYKASENIPSVRTLLPVPKFPAGPVPESTSAPATLRLDKAGQQPSPGPESTLHLQTRQVIPSPLQPPTRFSPELMRHVPVELPLADDAKPATARPIHDVTKTKTI
jgi:hypothetical protein